MEELSHVGMSLCFLCNEPKEILLDRRLKNSLPRQAVYNHEPCDKCKGFMKQGIILISVRDGESGDNPYRTGNWAVIKEEAVQRWMNDNNKDKLEEIIKKRVAFIDDTTWNYLRLPRGDK